MLLLAICSVAFGGQTPGAYTHKGLAVYPIFEPARESSDAYITLDEGVKEGTIIVTETGGDAPIIRNTPNGQILNQRINEQSAAWHGQSAAANVQRSGAQVNSLWLTNKSGKKLLLLSGEMVVGGKQDRIIQKDTIIPPTKKPIDLGVFCVEHGRWVEKSANFGTLGGGGGLVEPDVRGKAMHEQSQQAVWDKVAEVNAARKVAPTSGTYQENFNSKAVQETVDAYIRGINKTFPENRAVGVAVAVNGKLLWMDRFDCNQTFRKYWPKLLKSYALQASAHERGWKVGMGLHPTMEQAMKWANARDGKITTESENGVWALTKIESEHAVMYELADDSTHRPRVMHVSKLEK